MKICYNLIDMRRDNELNIGRDYYRNQYFFMTILRMQIPYDLIYFNKPIRRRDTIGRDIERCA
jgi:hypothetical protein